MFWRKPRATVFAGNTSELMVLATRLGVERRQFARVRYPNLSQVCKLPEIFFAGRPLKVCDLSVGGCALLDPKGLLGKSVGNEIELDLHFLTGVERVKTRIVSRVDNRCHMQFLTLSVSRQNSLKKFMLVGLKGQSVRAHSSEGESNFAVEAQEIWASIHGDGVVVTGNPEKPAEISFQKETFAVQTKGWPLKAKGVVCSRQELEQMILFLANIPQASLSLKELQVELESALLEGGRR